MTHRALEQQGVGESVGEKSLEPVDTTICIVCSHCRKSSDVLPATAKLHLVEDWPDSPTSS